MLDLWTSSDLPVLVELVRRLELEGEHRVDLPVKVDGLGEPQVEAALRRLHAAGYIDGVMVAGPRHPVVITAVTTRALQAVGAWPSPEQLVDRLLEALADTAENGNTDEDRSRARRTLEALRFAGRDVLVNAAGSALGGMALG